VSTSALFLIGLLTPVMLGLGSPAIAQSPAPTPPTTDSEPVPSVPPAAVTAPTVPPAVPILPPITSNEDFYKFRNGFPAIAQPDVDRLRLEIHIGRRQVALYRGDTLLKTYPIAVGKPGWETPTGTFKVETKLKDPSWVNPSAKDVVIPGGDPENPLGRFWIGFWTDGKNWIGFHGTPNPKSVGRAASHGCIRMHHPDIEALFNQVAIGTQVKVLP
jgi:lipoprotein-anchoring transpeptidase ErfK/SrfK